MSYLSRRYLSMNPTDFLNHVLIRSGAGMGLKNAKDQTPFDLAQCGSSSKITDLFNQNQGRLLLESQLRAYLQSNNNLQPCFRLQSTYEGFLKIRQKKSICTYFSFQLFYFSTFRFIFFILAFLCFLLEI